ncbi:MAG TPA: FG-GAP-like repeat-containing protein [Verrucomicrobiae bacterium]|nr:FG-GAP-like repeat-containing protein [Verrucomicrobiae bacterium]
MKAKLRFTLRVSGLIKLLVAAAFGFGWSALAADAVITKLSVPPEGKVGFTLIEAEKSGVNFVNWLPEARQMTNANLMNGSGVALGDFDNDGLCDMYFCSLAGSNVLYKNLGSWKFKDVTAEAGVACPRQSCTGAVFADLDGDGDLDLLVTSMGGPNACFINDGKGHFIDRTAEAGLVSQWGSSSMALGDLDGNGTLDLYVCNYGATSILRSGGTMSVGKNAKGEPVVLGRNSKRMKIIEGMLYELGEPDILYLNDGKGHFAPVRWGETFSDENGQPIAEAPWDQSLSVMFRDLNEDGALDIYLCADAATPDRIWINNGKGKFRAAPTSAIRKTSYFTMGVDAADIDRDGHDDIFMVDMLSRSHLKRITQQGTMHPQPNVLTEITPRFQLRRNVLLCGDGRGNFTEIGNYSGLAASDWTWSCVFLDVDLDGWEDVLVTNGFEHDVDDADIHAEINKLGQLPLGPMRRTLLKYPKLTTPNYAFHNLRDRTFKEVGAEWGFNSISIANGMALADLDNDGDMDAVVNCMNSEALIYRNDSPAPRVAVRLKGKGANTQGIGARISVTGGPAAQSQVIIAGGRYVSSDQAQRTFAAGATPLTVRVDWPNGARSEVASVLPNSLCEVPEPTESAPKEKKVEAQPLFANESAALNHTHRELDFDDFARQPSLIKQLNRSGPTLAAIDLNRDGFDDLIVGAGKGASGAVLLNNRGKFESISDVPANGDVTALVAFHKNGSVSVVVRAESNYEEPPGTDSTIRVLEFADKVLKEVQTLRIPKVTVGSLAVADIDGNNSLELFVGGRCLPGEYPRAASSFICRYDGQKFEIDQNASSPFRDIGLVTGAVFSDLNADGWPDLVLSLEWGKVRLFLNNKGAFSEAKLDSPSGLWTFVTTADVNADGLLDIVAGNWGLNSIFNSRGTQRLALYDGDLNDDGREAMFLAYLEKDRWLAFNDLGTMAKALPWLTTPLPTYAAYANATADQILSSHAKDVQRLEAERLESSLFLNRNGSFERKLFPPEAQFSTANGATVGDFNGDGVDDVFIAQNFFAVRPPDERVDAGHGLLLLGNEHGEFVPANTDRSGISMLAQQSSPLRGDFNNDGKVDLAVGQNSTATELFMNQRGNAGIRIRLRGPAGNIDGIGAQLRPKRGGSFGAAQEIRCASGPIGQDSFTQIFAKIDAIQVRWPGGKVSDHALPADGASVTIDFEKGLLPATN